MMVIDNDENIFLILSLSKIHRLLADRKVSVVDLAKVVIKRSEKFESRIKAWASFNPALLLEHASTTERDFGARGTGVLQGIPYGVKDIFNTKDYPTQMGSELWSDFKPGNNARVVDYFAWNGAVVAGKTNTAEFAVHHLNDTTNPHGEMYTPGTSSSGSAAAVAMGMIPYALATQTAASITRPASFCGVWGFKPSFGLIPRTGVLKTTDSLDTVGFISSNGRSLRPLLDAGRVRGKNFPLVHEHIDLDECSSYAAISNVGFVKTYVWDNAASYVKESVLAFVNKLGKLKNYTVTEIDWPEDLLSLHNIHEIIYRKSLSYYFQREAKFKGDLSNIMFQMIEDGKDITPGTFQNALAGQSYACKRIDQLFDGYDFIVSLGTASSAPHRGHEEAPDPSLIWTLAHVPTISVPLFKSPNNMPYSIQLTAKKWSDYKLLRAVEKLIDIEIFPELSIPIESHQTN